MTEIRVLAAALRVAAAPPEKPHTYVSSALVPWRLITELRAALDDAGIEWRER